MLGIGNYLFVVKAIAVLIKLDLLMSKKLALILSLTLATATMAADITCNAGATEKKLAGAAKTSYLKKCEKDATATCDAAAAEKKLAGAAKNSFTKKCVKDAVG